MTIRSTDRRTVLRGAAVIGAGAALTACGGGGSDTSSSGGADKTDAPTAAGTSLGKASEVPVGSGKIYADQKIVVTQPTEGDFKAFSAVCTHQGCIVSSVDKAEIHCACHGSAYSIKDGSVVNGPAPKALPSETVTDEGGTLKLG
ncbi:MAG: Rieske (2Fe-2S) protein [Aeromicrobium sp.]